MIFTLSTIFEQLPNYDFQCIDDSVLNKPYKVVQLLPLESEDLHADKAYITDPYDMIRFQNFVRAQADGGQNCLIYVYHSSQFLAEGASVYLETTDELAVVLNNIQEVVFNLLAWQKDLNSAANLEMEISTMLEIIQKMLQNPVAILSPSYSLWGQAGDIVKEDIILSDLVSDNQLSEKTIRQISTLKYIPTEISQSITLSVLKPDKLSPYSRILIMLPLSRYATAILYCVILKQRYRGSLTTCINTAADALLIRMKRSYTNIWMQGYEHFLIEMIKRNDNDPQDIAARAFSLNIPLESAFLLLCSNPISATISIEYCKDYIHRTLPESFPFIMDNKLVVLCRNANITNIQSTLLEKFLVKLHITFGVSNQFTFLTDMHRAWEQANTANKISTQLLNSAFAHKYKLPIPIASSSFYNYQAIAVYDAYQHAAEYISMSDLCVPELMDLINHPADKSSTIQVLYFYLMTSCSYVATGKMLHMHRNNVVYHITRLKEAGFQFDNFSFQQRLLSSFQVLFMFYPF